MARLIVRGIPQEIVALLQRRAAKRGHSAEAEHREILKEALMPIRGESLKAMLGDIPNIGRVSYFTRPRRVGRRVTM